MAHRTSLRVLPTVLFYVGLVSLLAGFVPLVRRTGGPLHITFMLAGAVCVILAIVVATRNSKAGP